MRATLLLWLFLSAFPAIAQEGISIKVSPTLWKDRGNWIDLSITNNSEKNICLNGRAIGLDGAIGASVFAIRSQGKPVRYRGIQLIQPPGYIDSGVALRVGGRITVSLSLEDYDIPRHSEFEIQYNSLSIGECHGQREAIDLISNQIKLMSN
jgi:hypothetical protein